MNKVQEEFVFDVLLQSVKKYEQDLQKVIRMTEEKVVQRELKSIKKDMNDLIIASEHERARN